MTGRLKAVLDVTAVFTVTLAIVGLFARSPFASWQSQVLHRNFGEYALMILIPLLIIVARRKNLALYGLSLRRLRDQLRVALVCAVPFAAGSALAMFVNFEHTYQNGLLATGSALAVLAISLYLLRGRPALGIALPAAVLFIRPALAGPSISNALSALIFYILFLGPGEEILFRGYIQSRLNEAFGRPYHLMGISWGWGLPIMALLFGLFHLLNLPALYAGQVHLLWWFGLSSSIYGLFFGFMREKTGSIVAPALVHGVPQGIAWAVLGW